MAQSKLGGLKAAKTNKRKYGRNYYRRIGKLGGKKGTTGGFHYMMINNRDRLKEISSAGGSVQRRGPAREEVT